MNRLLLFVFATDIILLSFLALDVEIYHQLIRKLFWAVETLKLDFDAERGLYLSCQKKLVPM